MEEQLRNLGRTIEDEQAPVSMGEVAPVGRPGPSSRTANVEAIGLERVLRHRPRRVLVGALAGVGVALLVAGLVMLAPDDLDVAPTESATTVAPDDSSAGETFDPSAPPPQASDTTTGDDVATTVAPTVPTTRAPATRATLPIPLDDDDQVFVASLDVKVVASGPAPWESFDADPRLGMRRDLGTAEWVGISFWDPVEVATDPCRWRGSLEDPGDSVAELADALVAVPGRSATTPVPITVGGYDGLYLEWSLPADLDVSTCDDEQTVAWTATRGGTRTHDAGWVDRIWILDVEGERILIDVVSLPGEQDVIRPRVDEVIDSLRFVVED